MINYKETQDLINELKADIEEFGKDEILAVWFEEDLDDNSVTYTNYDFIVEDGRITADELEIGEHIKAMPARKLLEALENQLEIL